MGSTIKMGSDKDKYNIIFDTLSRNNFIYHLDKKFILKAYFTFKSIFLAYLLFAKNFSYLK